ncbi:MAG: hypothetical protein Tsb002_15180 [Wenzhouxiangellaceae bacterium]
MRLLPNITKIHYPLGYYAALDGLRGIMTLGVIVAHINYLWLPGSVIFMDTFFIMSAYLITSILLKSYRKTGSLQFGVFYSRRFKRIFPAYYFMLLCFSIALLLIQGTGSSQWAEVATAAVYVSNWARAFDWLGMPYLGHTWSLSIEEQYYLLWPVLFLSLLLMLGIGRRLVLAVTALILAAAGWRYLLAGELAPVARLFNGLDTRADPLLLGCLLALIQQVLKPFERPTVVKALRWLSYPTFLLLAWVSTQSLYFSHPYYATGALGTSLLSTLLLAALVAPGEKSLLVRLLEWPPFVGIGRICYGLYLWHFPVFQILKLDYGLNHWWVMLIGVPLAFAGAGLSYRYIEKPFLTSKKRYQAKTAGAEADTPRAEHAS